MKRTIFAGVLVTASLVALVAWAPGALAAQDGRAVVVGPNVQLFGSGSSIGVTVRDVTADDVAKAKLDGQRGVVIESVVDGTPASRAGLRTGDIVLEYDGERVRSVMQFTRLVQETPSGRVVQAVVSRDGSRQTLSVTPEQRGLRSLNDVVVRQRNGGVVRLPEGGFRFDFEGLPEVRTLLSPRQLGATVTPLSEQLEGYFGVKNGVLVSAVESNSPASAAGLRAGDIITRINGRTVEGVNDVSEAVRNTAAGAQFEIVVMREKKELTLKAQLPDRRPASGGRGRGVAGGAPDGAEPRKHRGVIARGGRGKQLLASAHPDDQSGRVEQESGAGQQRGQFRGLTHPRDGRADVGDAREIDRGRRRRCHRGRREGFFSRQLAQEGRERLTCRRPGKQHQTHGPQEADAPDRPLRTADDPAPAGIRDAGFRVAQLAELCVHERHAVA